jgi:ABC-type sugar transport system ATPase subunit
VASVELRGLTKRFGSLAVVDDVSLRIDHGQLVCLLGPSGCGKTTTLRLIAGFLEPTSGEIHVGDRVVSTSARTVQPENRKMSMIFQSYALWPHMTVTENIIYGLRLRKLDRDTIAKKLAAILATAKLEPLAQRYPGELSGGQQQRVALGRAIIAETPVCLMDEPLSNLDAQLRGEMRREIRALQRRLGITMVYVTHDQTEAMTMADRVVLLRNGRIEQVGSPDELYARPATAFTAGFIGAPPMNLMKVNGALTGVRPEDMRIADDGMEAKVESVEYLGADSLVAARAGEHSLLVRVPGHARLTEGAAVHVAWHRDHEHHFDAQTGRRQP